MARYYTVVFLVNVMFAGVFYAKARDFGIRPGSYAVSVGISVFVGIMFPLLVGNFNLAVALAFSVAIAGICAYVVMRQGTQVLPQSAVEPRQVVAEPDEPAAEAEPDEPAAEAEPDEPIALDEVAASVEDNKSGNKSDLFGSYIERGFEAKTEGKLELAIDYFVSAMDFKPPLDLEFMLVIDICAMLRELGQYKKAMVMLAEFQKKRASNLLPAMGLELKTSFIYTEILYEMLVEANTPELPFSQVPAGIKASVEEKVNQWKNQQI